MLKNILKLLIISVFSIVPSFSVLAEIGDDPSNIRGKAREFDKAFTAGVKIAGRLYEENGGANLSAIHNIIASDVNLLNLVIESMYVGIHYNVVVQSDEGLTVVFVPIHNSGDEKITAWECYTNIDESVRSFSGSVGTEEYKASLIREYSENKLFSACVYMTTANIVANLLDTE